MGPTKRIAAEIAKTSRWKSESTQIVPGSYSVNRIRRTSTLRKSLGTKRIGIRWNGSRDKRVCDDVRARVVAGGRWRAPPQIGWIAYGHQVIRLAGAGLEDVVRLP